MSNVKFMEIRKRVEVLESLDEKLADMEKDVRYDYRVVKETITDRQKKHWKTDELMFDEEGNPIYEVEREWDYVEKPADEISDEDQVKLSVISDIRKQLLKLVF